MSILNLLKEKTADEKQNFLNSIRSKASSKLKNTAIIPLDYSKGSKGL